MTSHMGVQTFATERNSHAEFFIHAVLTFFADDLINEKRIQNYELESQAKYISEIASDVWDHKIKLIDNDNIAELWCQTTCYKGNSKGTPEPNKTYEVRETLVEGISLRQFFSNTKTKCRTVHFTVGQKKYTYQWFLDLKKSTYDKSIYVGEENQDILIEIIKVLSKYFTEEDKLNALKVEIKNKTSLGNTIINLITELKNWWDNNLPKSKLADQQWELIKSHTEKIKQDGKTFDKKGLNIKGRVNALVFEKDSVELDHLIIETAVSLLSKKPFLKIALEATSNWDHFCSKIKNKISNNNSFLDNIISLWSISSLDRLVVRRLLLRIHTTDSIAYVQDLNIEGISEHNLYQGDHTSTQTTKICEVILSQLKENNINDIFSLYEVIKSRGKNIINSARWFEAKNGTALKPSFDYVELALKNAGYKILKPSKNTLETIGYHSEISKETVKPYTNLKLIADQNNNILCVLKAKFFRDQEFPRRCKEEAFVGLSLKYTYDGTTFTERFPQIPLFMFIDMNIDCTPPSHALNRLKSFGWVPFFDIEDLILALNEVETKCA